MSDENNINNDEVVPIEQDKDPDRVARGKIGLSKVYALQAVKAISNKDSDWHLLQEIAQEAHADFLAEDPDSKPSVAMIYKGLIKKIKEQYEQLEPDKYKILMDALPQQLTVGKWTRSDGWDEAVWTRMRNSSLFSTQRRAAMINAVYQRGLTKSDNAAKMYLTLSGDYSEKSATETDKVQDTFREINKILHKKT